MVCASSHCKDVEIFAKKLEGDAIAVAVFNRADYFTQFSKHYATENVKVDVSRIMKFFVEKGFGLAIHESYKILDLWNQGSQVGILNLKEKSHFESLVAQHDAQVYKLVPIN